jgi:hypothetical protein
MLFLYFVAQSVPPKSGLAKHGKVPMSGGADSEHDAEPTVHHFDDVANYLQVCIFSNFKQYCLTS